MPFKNLQDYLGTPQSAASLAAFRIVFGFILFIDFFRYTGYGWVARNYTELEFHFTYFEALPVLSPAGIEAISWGWAIGAFMICAGLFYRLGCAIFLVCFGYLFLLEKANYLNHFYFTLLLAFCLLLVPANRRWSLDRWLGLASDGALYGVPRWSYVLLKGQIEIMLIWAGIVKITPDWLSGYPLNEWLPAGVVGVPRPIVPFITDPAYVIPAAWGSVILHLVAAPMLLIRRTRLIAFIVYCGFHLMNHWLWNIGIFPWLAIAGGLIFFAPDWPEKIWAGLRGRNATLVRGFGSPRAQPLMIWVVLMWLVSQALIPTRPMFFKGDVTWTEEGHRFSWRMKLRDKQARFALYVVDPTDGIRRRVRVRDLLSAKQARKMTKRPDMIIQFAHYVRDLHVQDTGRVPQIFADAQVSLNGRPMRAMIKPDVDLAQVRWHAFASDSWITPFVDNRTEGRP